MTAEQRKLLEKIKSTGEIPTIKSAAWDDYMWLVDNELVDPGPGYAELTDKGRRALK